MFDSLNSRGMTPNVTLSHFTMPQWFQELGAFTNPDNIPIFVEYAVKVRGQGHSRLQSTFFALHVLASILASFFILSKNFQQGGVGKGGPRMPSGPKHTCAALTGARQMV